MTCDILLERINLARSGGLSDQLKLVREVETLNTRSLQDVSIRFLRNYSLDSISPYLRFEALPFGLWAQPSFCDFNSFEQEILDPTSETNTKNWDLIVMSLWLDSLLPKSNDLVFDENQVFEKMKNLTETLLVKSQSHIVITNFLRPFWFLNHLNQGPDSFDVKLRRLNVLLVEWVRTCPRLSVLELDKLVAKLGEKESLDQRFWYMYANPFKPAFLKTLGAEIAATAQAVKNPPKKVLVLDCDNTLWGGVVGEEGIGGIGLGPHSYPGSAFFDFQKQILDLKARGVMLALCSKNNLDDVMQVLMDHPYSVIRKNDLSHFEINWEDKPTNLRRIATKLNVGLDSLVFVDDSPTECAYVRTQIPEVTVLQTPNGAYEIPSLLKAYRGFDSLRLTSEDLVRSKMYSDENSRQTAKETYQNLEDFFASLELQAQIEIMAPNDLIRVAQLTQKTNQFNLTTIRRTEAEIALLEKTPDTLILTLKAFDKFGEYGLTGILILARSNDIVNIETFLMSCRILGRGFEQAFLSRAIALAKEKWNSAQIVLGRYLKTAKNQQVENLYLNFNFAIKEESPDGTIFAAKLDFLDIKYPSYIQTREKK